MKKKFDRFHNKIVLIIISENIFLLFYRTNRQHKMSKKF